MKLNKKDLNVYFKRVFIAVLGLFLLGLSAAINIKCNLGSDPITVLYDGACEFFNLNIGIAINVINFSLVAIVFLLKRKHVNLGTLVYLLCLGTFVNIGMTIYDLFSFPYTFISRLVVSFIGCWIAFLGISLFMTADIGVDPWTAIAKMISEKLGKKFGISRMVIDILALIFGWIMGGTVGIITIFCAVVGGPAIQKICDVLDNKLGNMLKFDCKN